MSYQHTIETLRANVDDSFPQSYFSNFIEVDYDHEGFSRVQLPYTGFVDYIREVDDAIIVISDSDQWCDDCEDDGWTYAVFKSIEDYINEVFGDSCNIVSFDEGFNTFHDCFKSAVFDMLMNSNRI